MKKFTNWLGLSLLGCLVIGALLAKPVISWLRQPVSSMDSSIAYSSHAAYMGGTITTYAQSANPIIIGKVAKVSDPFLSTPDSGMSRQKVAIAIKEVLKGDPAMADITIVIDGGYTVIRSTNGEVNFVSPGDEQNHKGKEGDIGIISSGGEVPFKVGEKVLLFVGKTTEGSYVPFAGPYGKYLIDESDNVTSIGDFKMSLKDLKSKIQEALKLPQKEQVSIPVEEMY